jgi:hypothetical protein
VLFYAAVEELGAQLDESRSIRNLKSTWVKQDEIIKEPYLCSFLQNLLLYCPGDRLPMLGLLLSCHLFAFAFWGILKMLNC